MIPVPELTALFPEKLLDRLAVRLKVNKPNQIRLPGQAVFLCLLNGMLYHPELSQQLLADLYEERTGRSVSRSSFAKAFQKLPLAYFQALFTHLFRKVRAQRKTGEPPLLRLRRADATTVALSAQLLQFGLRGGTRAGKECLRQVKAVFSLEADGLPQLLRVCKEQPEANDNVALGDPMLAASAPGDLWLFDQGCNARPRLLKLHQAGSFFLTPHKDQSLRVLARLWEAPPTDGAAPTDPTTPPQREEATCRLLRVERAVFENSKDTHSAPAQAQWAQMPLLVLHAERWDQRTQRWVSHVLLTNLPVDAAGERGGPYTFWELLELYRRRWEIETFFKFLKQHLGYRHLLSHQEHGIRLLLWMTLLTAVLLIWYKHRTGLRTGWRSVKFWFAENTRAWITEALRRVLLPIPAT